jgi:hypothetical protein
MAATASAQAAYTHVRLLNLRIVCALERFHHAHQRYPETLASLVPDFIAQIPGDVVDGEPMRYQLVRESEFLLYSIGANGQDDGGSNEDDPEIPGSIKRRDWAWDGPMR